MSMAILRTMEECMTTYDAFIESACLDKKVYQRDGVEWILTRELSAAPFENVRGGIVADEMGLGKTILMIGTIISNPLSLPTLIVLPLALLGQWKSQIKKFTGHDAVVYHGVNKRRISREKLSESMIILTTYGEIATRINGANSLVHEIEIGRFIYDEAHHLRNFRTRVFEGASIFTKQSLKNKDVEEVCGENTSTSTSTRMSSIWLLSGTPIQNRVSDFTSLCSILWYSPEFMRNTRGDEGKRLLMDLTRWSLLKRTKKDVGIELEDVVMEITHVPWENNDEENLSSDIHGLLNCFSKKKSIVDTLPTFIKCKQACVYPPLLKKHESWIRDMCSNSDTYDVSNAFKSHSKLNSVCRTIIERKGNLRSKIVFCTYRGEIDYIVKKLSSENLRVEYMDGRTSMQQRDVLVLDTSIDVLVLQINTACEGLNLQHFKEVYFVSPHWNPAVEDQAIARCHRLGQDELVNVFRFEMETNSESGTNIDEYCTHVQEKKRDLYI